nr:expressed conserved protein [Hymenolepis microstoma]
MEDHTTLSFVDPTSEFTSNYPNGLSLDDLIPFYEDIENDKPLQLEWKFPGRIKRPSPLEAEQKNGGTNAVGNEASEKNDTLSNPPENQPDFTEFDFDTETLSSSAFPQALRPLGSSARPVRERRVARLDKILQEDRNLRRIEEQMRQAAEAAKKQQQLQQETQPIQPVEENTSSIEEKSSEPPLEEVHQTEQNVSNVRNDNPTTLDLPGQVEHMNINAAEETAI